MLLPIIFIIVIPAKAGIQDKNSRIIRKNLDSLADTSVSSGRPGQARNDNHTRENFNVEN
jgi:hypothetical protein